MSHHSVLSGFRAPPRTNSWAVRCAQRLAARRPNAHTPHRCDPYGPRHVIQLTVLSPFVTQAVRCRRAPCVLPADRSQSSPSFPAALALIFPFARENAVQHQFVPDDEGLFCLFCGRTAGEHLAAPGTDGGGDRNLSLMRGRTDDIAGAIDEEDDWDAIQDELKKLTRLHREESVAREKAEETLAQMKVAFEKLREDVGQIRTWGANSDSQLGHQGNKAQRAPHACGHALSPGPPPPCISHAVRGRAAVRASPALPCRTLTASPVPRLQWSRSAA